MHNQWPEAQLLVREMRALIREGGEQDSRSGSPEPLASRVAELRVFLRASRRRVRR